MAVAGQAKTDTAHTNAANTNAAHTNGWTPERRRRAAERIRRHKPWEHSTGPRTKAGKETTRCNAYKHGRRSAAMKDLRRAMRRQRLSLQLMQMQIRMEIKAQIKAHHIEQKPSMPSVAGPSPSALAKCSKAYRFKGRLHTEQTDGEYYDFYFAQAAFRTGRAGAAHVGGNL